MLGGERLGPSAISRPEIRKVLLPQELNFLLFAEGARKDSDFSSFEEVDLC